MKSLDLERLWSWLPTFRVVAEYESVGEAARLLQLSASSVSRSVRLLEEELGQPLFIRSRGRLILNDKGREFLEAVRRSMRLVDDGADLVRGSQGVFRLSAPRALLAEVLPAVVCFGSMQSAASSPVIMSDLGSAREVAAGIVDLLLVVGDIKAGPLEAHRLPDIQVGAFVAANHALAHASDRDFASAAKHAWVTAAFDFPDQRCWPPEFSRSIGLEVMDCVAARDACLAGLGPALLPRALVKKQLASAELVELTELSFAPVRAYALRRPRLSADQAEMMIGCLIQAFNKEKVSAERSTLP